MPLPKEKNIKTSFRDGITSNSNPNLKVHTITVTLHLTLMLVIFNLGHDYQNHFDRYIRPGYFDQDKLTRNIWQAHIDRDIFDLGHSDWGHFDLGHSDQGHFPGTFWLGHFSTDILTGKFWQRHSDWEHFNLVPMREWVELLRMVLELKLKVKMWLNVQFAAI